MSDTLGGETRTFTTLESSEHEMSSQSEYIPDIRINDPIYVLVKSYAASEGTVAQRLFELHMLATKAKDSKLLNIRGSKLSFKALNALDP